MNENRSTPALLTERLNLGEKERTIIKGLEEMLRQRKLSANPEQAGLQATLWWALNFGSDDQLREILAAGANPNITFPRGETPLGKVIAYSRPGRNRLAAVRLLLQAGADVNLPSEGEVPLALALKHNHADVFDILFESAGINQPGAGALGAMLVNAAAIGCLSAVQRLLAAAAPVNHCGLFQSACIPDTPASPLMLASFFAHPEIIKILLAAGADVNLKGGEGHTALDYARFDPKICRKVIPLLEKAGGVSVSPFGNSRIATEGFAGAARKPAYKAAVARIKKLAGAIPRPLEGVNDRIPGGYGFVLDEARARTLVEQYQAEVLAQGFYLFFTKDLTAANGSAVALLPAGDIYQVLAAVETEGPNSQVSNEDLITWLRELEEKQPFLITGIGSDFIEGRFTTPIKNPETLAKRINRLCPDGVEGPENEARQVEQLRQTGRLFLWWD